MKDQRGTSLVSVIGSFAVLMIVLLLLQVSITASGRYAAHADEVWMEAVQAENDYVNNNYDDSYMGSGGWDLSLKTTSGERWGSMKIRRTAKGSEDSLQIYYIGE